MQNLHYLLRMAVLLALCLANASNETHLDIPASFRLANTVLMVRVENKVDINYNYTLTSNGQWTQYPDMRMIIDLPFAQYVKVYYNIHIACGANGWLGTRVMIDGVQNNLLQRGTAVTQYPSVYMDTEVFIGKGSHTIHLQYRTSCGATQLPSWAWVSDIFQVSYYRQMGQ